MLTKRMINRKLTIIYLMLIFSLSLSRIIPHPPNFTPIISLAIIGPFLFGSIYLCLISILTSMIISDFFLGFYDGIIQIYIIISLICIIFNKLKENISKMNLLYYSLAGSVIFFTLTNLSVWYFGNLYTKDIDGLIYCYVMAIPFFTNTLLSTIIFSYLIFFISVKISNTQYVKN